MSFASIKIMAVFVTILVYVLDTHSKKTLLLLADILFSMIMVSITVLLLWPVMIVTQGGHYFHFLDEGYLEMLHVQGYDRDGV
ncbi:MAG: hypothetical protein HQL87_09745 [Magnetococcales bacterium]|nr:hypothetical protein [Magnetococcales bacterium]